MAVVELDRTDFRILAALQKNGRLSNKELAAYVHLAPSSCLERVRRLRDEGVLGDSHAEVDPEAMGVGLRAILAVQLRQHTRETVDSFHEHLLGLPEVVSIYHVAGEDDFLVHVAVKNAHHLRDLAMDAFTTRVEVARIRTSLVYRHERKWPLPTYRDERVP
jgi:DNA-binding Lrp family transcriptional regulator